MAARTKKARPGMRLKRGASVLVAAGAVDTRLVQAGVQRLQAAHSEYVDAQRRVDAAQAALDAARLRVRELRAVQDDAVETLARTLVGDGHRLKNPFTAFGAPSPSTIARLAVTDGATAIALLVAAVRRRNDTSLRSVHAARAALNAARYPAGTRVGDSAQGRRPRCPGDAGCSRPVVGRGARGAPVESARGRG